MSLEDFPPWGGWGKAQLGLAGTGILGWLSGTIHIYLIMLWTDKILSKISLIMFSLDKVLSKNRGGGVWSVVNGISEFGQQQGGVFGTKGTVYRLSKHVYVNINNK